MARIVTHEAFARRRRARRIATFGPGAEEGLLLLDEVWSGKIVAVEGDPVVAIPTRDLLLLTGGEVVRRRF